MEDVMILTRDINGKKTSHNIAWDKVAKYVYDMFDDEDEILLVTVEGTCIYSALESNPITKDDLIGFFG